MGFAVYMHRCYKFYIRGPRSSSCVLKYAASQFLPLLFRKILKNSMKNSWKNKHLPPPPPRNQELPYCAARKNNRAGHLFRTMRHDQPLRVPQRKQHPPLNFRSICCTSSLEQSRNHLHIYLLIKNIPGPTRCTGIHRSGSTWSQWTSQKPPLRGLRDKHLLISRRLCLAGRDIVGTSFQHRQIPVKVINLFHWSST